MILNVISTIWGLSLLYRRVPVQVGENLWVISETLQGIRGIEEVAIYDPKDLKKLLVVGAAICDHREEGLQKSLIKVELLSFLAPNQVIL